MADAYLATIYDIIEAHRQRNFAMDQRKRMDLALGAFLRIGMGWSKQLPKADRDRIAAFALDLISKGEKYVKARNKALKRNQPVPDLPADLGEYWSLIIATVDARKPFDDIEAGATRDMERYVQNLPIYDWISSIPGFGALGLAIIVAEAGRDLSDYSTVAKLWTRMGVGLRDGIRQGNLPKNAPKEQWITHRERRSRIWTIGSSLVKMNKDADGKPAYYRQTYLDRKAYERARAEANGLKVAPASSIPKGNASEYMSLGHIDKRAQRYMEKRLLRNLWVAWRERATYRV